MRLGALLGPVDPRQPKFLPDQARAYADSGYTSLWSAQAIGRGFMLSDPLLALTAAAAVTEDVEIGTAVLQVPLYHPADLAHRVFSLMQVCGDRLRLGIGVGSTEADFTAYSRLFHGRFQAFETCLEELRSLFETGESGTANLSPWPAVRGGPPILLGTWGRGVARAAAEFDGWIASAMHRTPDQVIEALGRFRAAGGQRAIVSTIQIGGDTDLGLIGENLARFAAAGFDDAVIMISPGGPTVESVRRLLA